MWGLRAPTPRGRAEPCTACVLECSAGALRAGKPVNFETTKNTKYTKRCSAGPFGQDSEGKPSHFTQERYLLLRVPLGAREILLRSLPPEEATRSAQAFAGFPRVARLLQDARNGHISISRHLALTNHNIWERTPIIYVSVPSSYSGSGMRSITLLAPS
jgi:hypothetical protein